MERDPTEKVQHNCYHIQCKSHANFLCKSFGSLLQHQTLVDVALYSGNKKIPAHKCVLAANSSYFRERLTQNPAVEQIVFNDLDFEVVKCIVEYMYCGETAISENNIKKFEAAAITFQLYGLQATHSNQVIPVVEEPLFLSKKVKYATPAESFFTLTLNPVPNVPKSRRKRKRHCFSLEAEKACAKEAAASRSAIDALNDDLDRRTNSTYVIEETCSETTVENFIPHREPSIVSVEVQNYKNLNIYESVTANTFNDTSNMHNVISIPEEITHFDESQLLNPITPPKSAENSINKRFNEILGIDIPDNIQVMCLGTDGNYIKVTEEMLKDMTAENKLSYQCLSEDGQLGEVREIRDQKVNSSDDLLIFDPRENSTDIASNSYSFPFHHDISMSDAEIDALLSVNSPNKKIGVDVAPRVNQVDNTDPFVNALAEIKEHLNFGEGGNDAKCETPTSASIRQLKSYCDKESYLLDEHNTTESNSVLPSCFNFESVKDGMNIIVNERGDNHANGIQGNGEHAKNEDICELSLKERRLETRLSPAINNQVPTEFFEEPITDHLVVRY